LEILGSFLEITRIYRIYRIYRRPSAAVDPDWAIGFRLEVSMVKRFVEQFHKLDIRTWGREGLLVPGQIFTSRRLQDGVLVDKVDIVNLGAYIVVLSSWAGREQVELCAFPALKQDWKAFVCPGCKARCLTLFGRRDEPFRCRACHGLRSEIENMSRRRRAERRLAKLSQALQRDKFVSGRPRGMHHERYIRLLLAHEDAQERVSRWLWDWKSKRQGFRCNRERLEVMGYTEPPG